MAKKQINIKYTKNVMWLKPFVESVQDLVPLHKLNRIRGYKVRFGTEENGWGQTSMYDDGTCSISLKVQDQVVNPKASYIRQKVHKNTRIEMILSTLGHELSHLKFWPHSPAHFKLQYQILLRFSELLEQQGITDHSRRATLK